MVNYPDLNDYFEKSPIALSMAAADQDHQLITVNSQFRELTGYNSLDVLNQNCRFLQRNDVRNARARDQIRRFLASEQTPNIRCELINYRKDGNPFINLLYMSKLRDFKGKVNFIFASQFDISRSKPNLLQYYDSQLQSTLKTLAPVATDRGLILEGSLLTIANTAAVIAQAKFTLASLATAAPQ